MVNGPKFTILNQKADLELFMTCRGKATSVEYPIEKFVHLCAYNPIRGNIRVRLEFTISHSLTNGTSWNTTFTSNRILCTVSSAIHMGELEQPTEVLCKFLAWFGSSDAESIQLSRATLRTRKSKCRIHPCSFVSESQLNPPAAAGSAATFFVAITSALCGHLICSSSFLLV